MRQSVFSFSMCHYWVFQSSIFWGDLNQDNDPLKLERSQRCMEQPRKPSPSPRNKTFFVRSPPKTCWNQFYLEKPRGVRKGENQYSSSTLNKDTLVVLEINLTEAVPQLNKDRNLTYSQYLRNFKVACSLAKPNETGKLRNNQLVA